MLQPGQNLLAVFLFWGAAFLLVSCATTPENDFSTNYEVPLLRTQIDFQPPNRIERIRLLEKEKREFEAGDEKLANAIAALETEREALYTELSPHFPECKRQRHCIASVAKAGTHTFERYEEIRGRLLELDRGLIEKEAERAIWTRRHELRKRSLYNRYVVYELTQAAAWHPRIRQILVHSLEAYPNRRSLSYRLAHFAEHDFVPTQVGDLDFQMLGRPVDEAAVLATFDVWLNPDPRGARGPERYLMTLLVNTHQLDPQFYEKGFLMEWSRRLQEYDQERLRFETFCGMYSIASPMLLSKLHKPKAKQCAEPRVKMQTKHSDRFFDRFHPENWLLPVAYTRADDQRSN